MCIAIKRRVQISIQISMRTLLKYKRRQGFLENTTDAIAIIPFIINVDKTVDHN